MIKGEVFAPVGFEVFLPGGAKLPLYEVPWREGPTDALTAFTDVWRLRRAGVPAAFLMMALVEVPDRP